MSIRDSYNNWAQQYDTNENKTRDLEAVALREVLKDISFKRVLEIGCGTGKNTAWFVDKANEILAVDLSDNMLEKAKQKITSPKVRFQQADILLPWSFATGLYDLVSFNLVLEHIENLDDVFQKVATVLAPGGHVYIGELHPFKQYAGSKARFETETGTEIVTCYQHHLSDFVHAAKRNGLQVVDVNEYFDDRERNGLPRILTLLLR